MSYNAQGVVKAVTNTLSSNLSIGLHLFSGLTGGTAVLLLLVSIFLKSQSAAANDKNDKTAATLRQAALVCGITWGAGVCVGGTGNTCSTVAGAAAAIGILILFNITDNVTIVNVGA
jgi:hypothetical protein